VPRPFEAADPAGSTVASPQFGTVRPEAAAETAQWRAESKRLDGAEDATLWRCAAEAWETLGRPHDAAYARWRQAHSLLAEQDRRHDAAQAIRKAADQAREHQPLSAAIDTLAHRARIELQAPQPAAAIAAQPSGPKRHPFALTDRELTVLRLVADGKPTQKSGRRCS
jgi:ATP/maltotriose-dependent transcriptional regulator MalT